MVIDCKLFQNYHSDASDQPNGLAILSGREQTKWQLQYIILVFRVVRITRGHRASKSEKIKRFCMDD